MSMLSVIRAKAVERAEQFGHAPDVVGETDDGGEWTAGGTGRTILVDVRCSRCGAEGRWLAGAPEPTGDGLTSECGPSV
jgi:hypothetical protein